MLKKLMPALALATAALSATQPAFAQSASTYPNKPIHIIVTFTSGGYALLTLRITRPGLYRVVPSPASGNRASLYAPDGQPGLQPFFPNDSVYRLQPGDHTLLVWADDAFSATLRTEQAYTQPVKVRSIR